MIELNGATLDKLSFKDSNKTLIVTFDGDKKSKLTINRAVVDDPIMFDLGGTAYAFGSMPGGVTYADNKKSLKIADPFSGTLDANDYAASVVTLDGSTATGNIELIGSKKAKVLKGGAGKSTLVGSTAADIFHGGTGTDTFVYSVGGGKDVINGFGSSDVISVGGATVAVTDIVEKNNDIILTVGKGSITLKDAPRGTVTVKHDGGTLEYKTMPTGVTYDPKKNVLKTTAAFDGTLIANELGVLVKEINASASTKAVDLRADSNTTKITAGKGGGTLTGGAGNDTLIGGNGNDLFITSGGNDLIDKYTAGKDKIKINGTLSSGKVNGSNVELTTSEGTVTVKGVVNKELTLVVDGNDRKYKFTKKETTLETAALTSNAQLPSELFDVETQSDPLDDILAIKNISVDFDEDFSRTNILRSNSLIYSARSRHKK